MTAANISAIAFAAILIAGCLALEAIAFTIALHGPRLLANIDALAALDDTPDSP